MALDKEKLKKRVEVITCLVNAFCKEKLNDDYYAILIKTIGKLNRKRPSPLLRGKETIWAAGIVHAIGHINFLGDKSFEPYVYFNRLRIELFESVFCSYTSLLPRLIAKAIWLRSASFRNKIHLAKLYTSYPLEV